MYQGIRTDGYLKMSLGNRTICFLYSVFFVLRRATIVIALVMMFKTKQEQLLYILLAVQTVYIVYIFENMPHVQRKFNILELINEVVTTLIIYTLMGFLKSSQLNTNQQWKLGYITIVLISVVFLLNFVSMIYILVTSIKRIYKKKKAQKAYKLSQRRKLSSQRKQKEVQGLQLIDQQSTSRVIENLS